MCLGCDQDLNDEKIENYKKQQQKEQEEQEKKGNELKMELQDP